MTEEEVAPDVAPVPDTVFVIDQSSYYDNVLTPKEALKPGDEFTDSNYPGFVMLKAVVPGETQSIVRFREEALDEFNANRRLSGAREWTKAEYLIYTLANAVLPGHAPPGSVRSVSSVSDPETAAMLNAVFSTPQAPAESAPVPPPVASPDTVSSVLTPGEPNA